MATPGVPLNHERGGSVLRGVETFNLDQFSLFDKIINIKFIRRSGAFFVLRSDYEVAFDSENKPHFVTIRQKPAISVKYKQVSNSTAINVDVRVTNQFFNTEKTGLDIFTNAAVGDPVKSMEIQMGYRTMFPNWTVPPLAYDRPEDDPELNRLKLFYEMGDFQITNVAEKMDTALRLKVLVLATYNENNPPDRVTYFQGIVGSTDYGFPWTKRGVKLQEYFKEDVHFPEGMLTIIERVFFTYMTSRFFRPGVTYRIEDPRADPARNLNESEDKAAEKKVKAFVMDYDPATHAFLPMVSQVKKKLAERWYELPGVDDDQAAIPVEDATNLGVWVVLTERVKTMSSRNLRPATTNDGSQENTDSEEQVPGIRFQLNEGAQMLEIQAAYPKIRWYRYMNGNFLVYHEDEAIETVVAATEVSRVRRWQLPLLLPAVYDITLSGVRTIRCPFISFLSPGQKVGFQAKYNIADLVGFFYPHTKDMWFTVIIADVEFSTVGEENMMTLMCVDAVAPPEAKQLANEEPDEEKPEGSSQGAQGEGGSAPARTERGDKIQWAASRIDSWALNNGKPSTASSWLDLAKNVVLDNPKIRGVEGVPQRPPGRSGHGPWTGEAINWFINEGKNSDGGKSNKDFVKDYTKFSSQGGSRSVGQVLFDRDPGFLQSLGAQAGIPFLYEGDIYNFPDRVLVENT